MRSRKERGVESSQELFGLTKGSKGSPSKAQKSDEGSGDIMKGPPSLSRPPLSHPRGTPGVPSPAPLRVKMIKMLNPT